MSTRPPIASRLVFLSWGAVSAAGLAQTPARTPVPHRNHTLLGNTHIGVSAHGGAVRLEWFVWDEARSETVLSAPLPVAEVHRIRPLDETTDGDVARFLFCGQTAQGTGVVGLFTAHRGRSPRLTLDGALSLPQTLVLDAAYHASETRLYVLDGQNDCLRIADWRDDQPWPTRSELVLDAGDDASLAAIDTLEVTPGQPGVLGYREGRPGWPSAARGERVRLWCHGDGVWMVATEFDEPLPDWALRTQGWAELQPTLTITAHGASDGFEVVDVDSGAVLLQGQARRGQEVTLPLPSFCAAWPGRQVRVHGARVGRSPALALVSHWGQPWRSSDRWVARLAPLLVDSAACRVAGDLALRTTLTRTKPVGHGDTLAGFVLLALRDPEQVDPVTWRGAQALLEPTAIVPFRQDHSWPRPEVDVRADVALSDNAALAEQVVLLQVVIAGPGGELLFSDVLGTTVWPEFGPRAALPTLADDAARARGAPAARAAWRRWLDRAGWATERSPLATDLLRERAALVR